MSPLNQTLWVSTGIDLVFAYAKRRVIFTFWSFEISEGILRNHFTIGLYPFSKQILSSGSQFVLYHSCVDYPVKIG